MCIRDRYQRRVHGDSCCYSLQTMSVAHKTPKFAGEPSAVRVPGTREALGRKGMSEGGIGAADMNFPLSRELKTARMTPGRESECSSRTSTRGEDLDPRQLRRSGTNSDIADITRKYSNLLDNIQKERLRINNDTETRNPPSRDEDPRSTAAVRRTKENVLRSTTASSKSSRSNLQDELNRSIEMTINNGDNALKLFNSSSSTCKGEEEEAMAIRVTRKEFVKTTKGPMKQPSVDTRPVAPPRKVEQPLPAAQPLKGQLQSKIDFINSLYDKLACGPTDVSTERVAQASRLPLPSEEISSESPSLLSINRKELSGEVIANLQEYTFNEESFEVENRTNRSQSQRIIKTPTSRRGSIAEEQTLSRRSSKRIEVLIRPKEAEERRRTPSVSRATSEEKRGMTFEHLKLERAIKRLNNEYTELKKMPRYVGLVRGNVPMRKEGPSELSRKEFAEQLTDLTEKVESAVKALVALVSSGK
eukprot:TRINITY_DN12112_c0_g1_i1.p1 TRINITY_DN12112_c0_g1~~TRINITY_DN12112_c0_g1_i1.p1  ORF type:complete len:494 (+),score=114.55 TRINITY_DN12112_c0_g1_i1:60-1484(+)